MRFAEAIKLLAASFATQEAFLANVPENTSVAGYTKYNDVYRMAVLYLDSISVQEGQGGTEGVDRWRARTQIPRDALANKEHPLWRSTAPLSTALQMLVELDKPFLYTRHGLRSAHEWGLIRYLASQVCDTMGWPRALDYASFEALCRELGDGVIDFGCRHGFH